MALNVGPDTDLCVAFRDHIAERRTSYTDKVEKPAHSMSQTGADTQSAGVHSPSYTAVTATLSDIHQTSLAKTLCLRQHLVMRACRSINIPNTQMIF